jgi:lysylphosphatidylglycerol synthetase-like protein (DUF2156 family)
MEQRPKTVPIVAAFLFAAAAIAAVVGCSLLFPGTLLDRLWDLNKPGAAAFHVLGRISAILVLLLGAATSAAALGLLRGRNWAWWFAMVLFAVDACGDVVSFAARGDWVRSASGVAISSAFLYSLIRPPVRRYFKHERQ